MTQPQPMSMLDWIVLLFWVLPVFGLCFGGILFGAVSVFWSFFLAAL